MIHSLIQRLFRRPTHSLTYLPVIDGIRFVAILMVFLHHAGYVHASLFPGVNFRLWNHIVINGSKGVMIFFMLSGFILSLPFVRQYAAAGQKVGLRSYYVRRLVRLEPPYIMIMCFWCLLQIIRAPQFAGSSLEHLLVSVFYSHNIVYRHFSFINVVTWSLEVEVQFYLLAPFLCRIFLLERRTRRMLLLGLSILCCALSLLYPLPFVTLYKYLAYFLLGMLLADLHLHGWSGWLSHSWVPFLFLLLTAVMYLLPLRLSQGCYFLLPFLIFAWMMPVLGNEQIGKWFSYGWLPLIGGMCYSIYLIHFPLLNILGDWIYGLGLRQAGLTGLILYLLLFSLLTLLVSAAYFLLVEKPFMKLSTKIK